MIHSDPLLYETRRIKESTAPTLLQILAEAGVDGHVPTTLALNVLFDAIDTAVDAGYKRAHNDRITR